MPAPGLVTGEYSGEHGQRLAIGFMCLEKAGNGPVDGTQPSGGNPDVEQRLEGTRVVESGMAIHATSCRWPEKSPSRASISARSGRQVYTPWLSGRPPSAGRMPRRKT